MKERSTGKIRAEASRGKNEPLAKTARVATGQNGETRATRQAAKAQPGTDEAEDAKR
jgi:hypothetical protein